MWLWASPLNTRFTEYLPLLISHLRVLNIELLFFSILIDLSWQQTFFPVLVLMTRRYGKNLLMFLKDKSCRTMMDHAKSEPEAVRNWEYFGCGWIPGKEPVYIFQGNWSSIIDDMIFNHWLINYVASQFHSIKIMIFNWQWINETHQCTRAEVFDWHVVCMGNGLITTSIWKVMKPCCCMSSCLKDNVPVACNDALSADNFLLLFLSDNV